MRINNILSFPMVIKWGPNSSSSFRDQIKVIKGNLKIDWCTTESHQFESQERRMKCFFLSQQGEVTF